MINRKSEIAMRHRYHLIIGAVVGFGSDPGTHKTTEPPKYPLSYATDLFKTCLEPSNKTWDWLLRSKLNKTAETILSTENNQDKQSNDRNSIEL